MSQVRSSEQERHPHQNCDYHADCQDHDREVKPLLQWQTAPEGGTVTHVAMPGGEIYEGAELVRPPDFRKALFAMNIVPVDKVQEDTLVEQLAVFANCLQIHAEGHIKYGRAWARWGWNDSLHHIRHKATRLVERWFHKDNGDPDDLSDAYDLINYCGFFIRNVGDDNQDGPQ